MELTEELRFKRAAMLSLRWYSMRRMRDGRDNARAALHKRLFILIRLLREFERTGYEATPVYNFIHFLKSGPTDLPNISVELQE